MQKEELTDTIKAIISQATENEWVEFKHNFHSSDEIGERISALSNSACLHDKSFGYLIFGVEDKTCEIIGTTFRVKSHKQDKEELEFWLTTRLNPKIDFTTHELEIDGKNLSVFVIPATYNQPIAFFHKAYIRVGSYTKLLNGYPQKEGKIWRNNPNYTFEKRIAKSNVSATEIIGLLNTTTYFDLLGLPYPVDQGSVIQRLLREKMIIQENVNYHITNLGAILLAKNLNDFEDLTRKSVRVIVYQGNNKVKTEREQIGQKGYAVGFEGLIDWINSQLPVNEEIGKALRKETRMYPEIAIRELVANLLVHQDFTEKGFPTIEIFSDRIEFSNPGKPKIDPERFIDEYTSRNEKLANLMRRMRICEEKGSGIDKIITAIELYQLPALDIEVKNELRTYVTMYSYKELSALNKEDRIKACYQHACLCWVSKKKMTNQSLRERFSIEEHNASTASRIIKEALEAKKIKEDAPESNSRKYASYLPFWA